MAPVNDENFTKPCKTCTDFKTWSSLRKKEIQSEQVEQKSSPKENVSSHIECPVDKDELGRSTWNLLHTVAAFYPDAPSESDKRNVNDFFRIMSVMYPCEVCAEDFRKQLEQYPPKSNSQADLSQWLCRIHNRINLKIGKPAFDCSKVNERWRDGWADGSCD